MRNSIFYSLQFRNLTRSGRALILTTLVVSLVSTASADKVGINFVGGTESRGTPSPLKPSELAGAFPQKFWNNANGASGKLSPVGDDETGSSVSYVDFLVNWTAPQTNTNPIAPLLSRGSKIGKEGPPDYRLMLGYLDAAAGQPVTVTLTNIPTRFVSDGRSFSLVVYFHLDNLDLKNQTSSDKIHVFTLRGKNIGEKTVYGSQPSGAKQPLGGWVAVPEDSSKDEHEATPAGNYLVFSNLTDTELVLTAKGGFTTDGNPEAAINAIQIIPHHKASG